MKKTVILPIVWDTVGLFIGLGLALHFYSQVICNALLLVWVVVFVIMNSDLEKKSTNVQLISTCALMILVPVALSLIFRSSTVFLIAFFVIRLALDGYALRRSR